MKDTEPLSVGTGAWTVALVINLPTSREPLYWVEVLALTDLASLWRPCGLDPCTRGDMERYCLRSTCLPSRWGAFRIERLCLYSFRCRPPAFSLTFLITIKRDMDSLARTTTGFAVMSTNFVTCCPLILPLLIIADRASWGGFKLHLSTLCYRTRKH